MPHGRILNGHALDAHVLAVVKDDELGPGMVTEHTVILNAARLLPPALAVAVDGALAGDGDVGCVFRAHQRLKIGQAEFGLRQIVRVLRRSLERRPLVQL